MDLSNKINIKKTFIYKIILSQSWIYLIKLIQMSIYNDVKSKMINQIRIGVEIECKFKVRFELLLLNESIAEGLRKAVRISDLSNNF